VNIVIATDGALGAATAAGMVAPMAAGGTVTVLTVVEVPRRLLSDLRAVYGERSSPAVDADAEYVGIAPAEPDVGRDFPGEDSIIDQYLANQRDERTGPVVDALEAAGVSATVEILESENTARTIITFLKESKADLAVLGTHGLGLFEGLLGAIGTKVARHAPCSVLLIRS
jgi:nucleotide-binding universal stress UspA family protein